MFCLERRGGHFYCGKWQHVIKTLFVLVTINALMNSFLILIPSGLFPLSDGSSPAGHLLEIFTRPKMKLLDFCTPHAYKKDYESLSVSELSPNFTMQIDALRKFLYRSKPKALADGHYASGRGQ